MGAPRVPVYVLRHNRQFPGGIILAFSEPCPYCGRRHRHGHATADPLPDGTYGHRSAHCVDGLGEDGYILVPEVGQEPC